MVKREDYAYILDIIPPEQMLIKDHPSSRRVSEE